jgi:osmotically-inducible protein OsmY
VTTKVKTALHSDELVKSFDIAVVTLKGDVRLTGAVDNQVQLDHIDKLVRSIEGVHSIHDELTIKK